MTKRTLPTSDDPTLRRVRRVYGIAGPVVDRLVADGLIRDEAVRAAEAYALAHRRAGFAAVRCSSCEPRAGGAGDMTDAMVDARAWLRAADAAIGEPGASVVWAVVGDGSSLADAARRIRWGRRPMSWEATRFVLVAALGALAQHCAAHGSAKNCLRASKRNVRQLANGR